MKNPLVILALVLIVPTTAHAAPTGTITDPSTGASYTIAATDQLAVTTTPTDALGWLNTGTGVPQLDTTGCQSTWTGTQENGWDGRAQWVAAGSPRSATSCVQVGGQVVTYSYSRLRFADIPPADIEKFSPATTLLYAEYVVEGRSLKVGYVSVNSGATLADTGSTLEEYCNTYTLGWPGDPSPGVAVNGTPPSVYAACAAAGRFTRHASDPQAAKPAATVDALTAPSSAARCAAVGKVVVRATAVKCATARTVVARYARSLKSPAGWTCSAAVNDAGRRVRCAPRAAKGRAAAKAAVYGVWRS